MLQQCVQVGSVSLSQAANVSINIGPTYTTFPQRAAMYKISIPIERRPDLGPLDPPWGPGYRPGKVFGFAYSLLVGKFKHILEAKKKPIFTTPAFLSVLFVTSNGM